MALKTLLKGFALDTLCSKAKHLKMSLDRIFFSDNPALSSHQIVIKPFETESIFSLVFCGHCFFLLPKYEES